MVYIDSNGYISLGGKPRPEEARRELDSQKLLTSADELMQALKEIPANPDKLVLGKLHGIFSVKDGLIECHMVEGVHLILVKFQGNPQPMRMNLMLPPPAQGDLLKKVENRVGVIGMTGGTLIAPGALYAGCYDRIVKDPKGHVVLCYIGGKTIVELKNAAAAKDGAQAKKE